MKETHLNDKGLDKEFDIDEYQKIGYGTHYNDARVVKWWQDYINTHYISKKVVEAELKSYARICYEQDSANTIDGFWEFLQALTKKEDEADQKSGGASSEFNPYSKR